jgi:hypothetical protein
MFSNMVAFLQARSWDGSKRILASHPELMNDTGQSTLGFMISDRETVSWIYPGVDPERSDILIRLHYVLLGRCRQIGIREAFTELVTQIGPVASGTEGKAILPLSSFLTAADQDEALAVLRKYPGLAAVATASLVDRLIATARERGEPAIRRRLAERRRLLERPDPARAREAADPLDNPWVVATLAVIGLVVIASAAGVILMQRGGPGGSGSDSAASGAAPTAVVTGRTSPPEAEPSATGETQKTAATTPPESPTPEVADAHASTGTTSRPTTADPNTQPSDTASPTGPPDPSPPQIDDVDTYQEGELVFFSILFSDPDGDAEGFGFRGANGSTRPEETHPFSSPGLGRVGPGRIDYPFNLGCGTYEDCESDVEAWIYDSSGRQSQLVVIHLACTPP